MNEQKSMTWLATRVLSYLGPHRDLQLIESHKSMLTGKTEKEVIQWLCNDIDPETKALVENCFLLRRGSLNSVSQELEEQFQKYEENHHLYELRKARIQKIGLVGIEALDRLLTLAETRESGQIRRVALFIGACFNGNRHFDFYDFRSLDEQIGNDMMDVLNAHRLCNMGVDSMTLGGTSRIDKMLRKWGMSGDGQQGQLVV